MSTAGSAAVAGRAGEALTWRSLTRRCSVQRPPGLDGPCRRHPLVLVMDEASSCPCCPFFLARRNSWAVQNPPRQLGPGSFPAGPSFQSRLSWEGGRPCCGHLHALACHY